MLAPRLWMTVALSGAVVAAAFIAPHLQARADELPRNEAAEAQAPPPPVAAVVEAPPAPAAEPPVEPAVAPEPPPAVVAVAAAVTEPLPVASRRSVDIVIALDQSGSMGSLLDSTRARLWDIVNQTVVAKPAPTVRVGLMAYGAAADGGTVVMDLTTDLDTFYERLMALQINGGTEYVGATVDASLTQMSWSEDPNAVRMIFVAGNESADQGRAQWDFRQTCANAVENGVTVHSIFAGNEETGRAMLWEQVAHAGGGLYAAIDMGRAVVAISTPYDDEMVRLNTALNGTYVTYGAHGAAGLARQREQDQNSVTNNSLSKRATTKGSGAYDNRRWDLVDGRTAGQSVADLEESQLPAEMKGMTTAERDAFVDAKAAERARIQGEIADLSRVREAWERDERAKQAAGQAAGLDDAIEGMVVHTMSGAGFAF